MLKDEIKKKNRLKKAVTVKKIAIKRIWNKFDKKKHKKYEIYLNKIKKTISNKTNSNQKNKTKFEI
jgi:hypothetical protein